MKAKQRNEGQWMDRSKLEHQYLTRKPLYDKLTGEVKYILEDAIRKADIQIHGILDRVKTLDSLYEKALRKDIEDPFFQIMDIAGVRVVCLFLSDLERLEAILKQSFEVMSVDAKVNADTENMFGYMSNHYIVKLPGSYSGPRYDDIAGIVCEIQTRTIAMDAWATISHYLTYKQPADVPYALRRNFFALSGLFYVADTNFESFAKAAMQSRATEQKRAEEDRDFRESPLNLDTLSAFLAAFYPDRATSRENDMSELLGELIDIGYETVGQLDGALKNGYEQVLVFERAHRPRSKHNRQWAGFSQTGAVRVTLRHVDPKFEDLWQRKSLRPPVQLRKKE